MEKYESLFEIWNFFFLDTWIILIFSTKYIK